MKRSNKFSVLAFSIIVIILSTTIQGCEFDQYTDAWGNKSTHVSDR